MEFFLSLIGAGIVNYRISRMLAMEDGAFDIFHRFREWVSRKTTGIRYVEGKRQHWIDAGLNCPLCIGFWLALPLSIVMYGSFNVWQWFVVAGIQTFLQKMERE